MANAPKVPTLDDLNARLENGRWVELGVYGDETEARIEPFDAVPLNVADGWV